MDLQELKMTLVTGKSNYPRLNKSRLLAFSLLEMLVVIALAALTAGVVATNFDSIIRSFERKAADTYLFEALREARYQANILKENCYLSFDPESASFILRANSAEKLDSFPTQRKKDALEVSFFQLLPDSQLEGRYSPTQSSVAIKEITVTPSGISTAAVVTIKEENNSENFQLDPFSSSEITTLLPSES